MNNDDRVRFFDTTLRDGEQSPGASMNTAEKLRLAIQLESWEWISLKPDFPPLRKETSRLFRKLPPN